MIVDSDPYLEMFNAEDSKIDVMKGSSQPVPLYFNLLDHSGARYMQECKIATDLNGSLPMIFR